jgi:predicted kinase
MLVIFGGLPGAGKTEAGRELARQLKAVYVRIDSIEQALRDSGALRGPLNDAGYRAGYRVAEDNLRLGRVVVADSVNPVRFTRNAWQTVAKRAGVKAVEIEVKCSDASEHRRRVEGRSSDIPDLKLPTWQEVKAREYEPWNRRRIVVDTAGVTVKQAVRMIRLKLRKRLR